MTTKRVLVCLVYPQFMGVLTSVQPSILLSTGWSLLPEAASAEDVRLAFHVETATSLSEKLATKPPVDAKKEFARRVALNLYRFVESFQGSGDSTLLDRWFERSPLISASDFSFEARYKHDPNFVMKSE